LFNYHISHRQVSPPWGGWFDSNALLNLLFFRVSHWRTISAIGIPFEIYLDVLGVEEGFKVHYIPKCMEIMKLVRLLFQLVWMPAQTVRKLWTLWATLARCSAIFEPLAMPFIQMWHNLGGINVQDVTGVDTKYYFFMVNNLGGILNFCGLL